MNRKSLAPVAVIFMVGIALIVSPTCTPAVPGGGSGGGGNTDMNGTVSGQVSSLGGMPIARAIVTLNDGRSTSTDDNGFYSFEGLTAGARVVLSFRATGFANTSKAINAGTGPACVLMAEAAETVTISADDSETQRSGDSVVTLQAGSLVDSNGAAVTGDVELTATFLDPSGIGVMAFPGSFDEAATMTGDVTSLESFGFAIYELTQEGEEVNLSAGSSADIEYILPDNAQGRFTAGDSIPLWEFVEATAMWEEAGSGTIGAASDGSGRLAWFATVDHFSAWNCDAPLAEKTTIRGRIVSGDGATVVSGAEVSAVGVDYNGTSVVRSQSDGTFCIEVKRGSTVNVEVRLNGAATPIITEEVVTSDEASDCTTGPSTDVGDLSISLDACVFGTVLDSDGMPASGITVFVVPGATTTTASDGTYCAAAAGGQEVYVFAQGRPSVAVVTPESGMCGGSDCVQADLLITLPGDGDQVGTLLAQSQRVISSITGDSETFSLSGTFLVADAMELSGLGIEGSVLPGLVTNTQEIDECTVTTQTLTISSDDDTDPELDVEFGGIGALDPGSPGVATNGIASVNLLPGDPSQADPPAPFLAGIYSPEESSDELAALGFAGSQVVNFSFPGGADIGSFSADVVVPDDLMVTTPDLTVENLTIDTTAAWDLEWVPGTTTDTIHVTISQATSETTIDEDDVATITNNSTQIFCEFSDDGTGTIPAAAMALLPEVGASTTSITFSRQRVVSIAVPLQRVTGNGIMMGVGSTGVFKFETSATTPDIPDLPDLPDLSDLCDFITCPEGQTCNPETFLCE